MGRFCKNEISTEIGILLMSGLFLRAFTFPWKILFVFWCDRGRLEHRVLVKVTGNPEWQQGHWGQKNCFGRAVATYQLLPGHNLSSGLRASTQDASQLGGTLYKVGRRVIQPPLAVQCFIKKPSRDKWLGHSSAEVQKKNGS